MIAQTLNPTPSSFHDNLVTKRTYKPAENLVVSDEFPTNFVNGELSFNPTHKILQNDITNNPTPSVILVGGLYHGVLVNKVDEDNTIVISDTGGIGPGLTSSPSEEIEPIAFPTTEPSTYSPTEEVTFEPSDEPSNSPTYVPTTDPTFEPSSDPTFQPSEIPTAQPTFEPTFEPSDAPTNSPDWTATPTDEPTVAPTNSPDWTAAPTFEPSYEPSFDPTSEPTAEPSFEPTSVPTVEPTPDPTAEPSFEPTSVPTLEPTPDPTAEPSLDPTSEPTFLPTFDPTAEPSYTPTYSPTADPTFEPSYEPSYSPTDSPTPYPTSSPTYSYLMSVSQVVTGMSYETYTSNSDTFVQVFGDSVVNALGGAISYSDVGIVGVTSVSTTSEYQASIYGSTTGLGVDYTINTFSVTGYNSTIDAEAALGGTLQSAVSSGQFSAYLQANAAALGVTFFNATSSSLITIYSQPTLKPSYAPGSPTPKPTIGEAGEISIITVGVIVIIVFVMIVVIPMFSSYLMSNPKIQHVATADDSSTLLGKNKRSKTTATTLFGTFPGFGAAPQGNTHPNFDLTPFEEPIHKMPPAAAAEGTIPTTLNQPLHAGSPAHNPPPGGPPTQGPTVVPLYQGMPPAGGPPTHVTVGPGQAPSAAPAGAGTGGGPRGADKV